MVSFECEMAEFECLVWMESYVLMVCKFTSENSMFKYLVDVYWVVEFEIS